MISLSSEVRSNNGDVTEHPKDALLSTDLGSDRTSRSFSNLMDINGLQVRVFIQDLTAKALTLHTS